MKSRPVIPRVAAQRDVVDAIDHYLKEASAGSPMLVADPVEEGIYTDLESVTID